MGGYSLGEEGTRIDVWLIIYVADLGSNISMAMLDHTLTRFLSDEIAVAIFWEGK